MDEDQGAPQSTEHDGSLAGAVAAMPDFDDSNLIPFDQARDGVEPKRRDRDDQGRFTQAEKAKEPAKQADPAQDEPADDPEAISAPEEEFFELPPEQEGGEPVRISATEVFEGYQRSRELQAELEEARRVAPPPIEYDQQIYETVQTRGRLMQDLQTYAEMLRPAQPNLELLNEASPNFNPSLYYQQVQMADQMGKQLQAVRNQMQQLQADQTREQEALTQARFARERGKLQQLWPDVLANPQKAQQVRDAAARYYNIDNQTFAQTIDARFYAVLKDALAYRDGLKAQQTAVKVVRSKPKLVRAAARSGGNPKQQAVSNAMRRAQRSGGLTMDEAADAIGGLLG